MATYIITDSGNAVTNMTNAQAQLNACVAGDILELTKNVNFDGTLTLPAKAAGTADIIITTTGTLPAAGTRIAPANSAEMPKIRVNVNNASAIKTCDPAAGVANCYTLRGLELIDNAFGGSTLCNLGSASTTLVNKQDSAVKVPGYITVDRCIMRGQSSTVGTKRGIGLQGSNLTITECYIYNVFKVGADTQAIGGWNGLGNYTISNNYLEAAGENVLMGGADPIIPSLVPQTMTFTRNDVVKLVAWKTDGFGRTVKNLFEIKNFAGAHIYGNKFYYCWTAAQPGYPILITPVNQDGSNNATVITDILFELNEIAHVPGGVNITSHDAASTLHISQRTQRITIRNNLFWDMGPTWGNSLRAVQSGSGSSVNTFEGVDTLVVDHNTMLGDPAMNAPLYLYTKSGAAFAQCPSFEYTNNLTRKMSFGIKGDSSAEGTTTLASYATGYVCTANAIASATAASYPAGNFGPTEVFFQAQFVNYAGGNYRIDPLSAYHHAGTDGADLGADIDAIDAAYAAPSTGVFGNHIDDASVDYLQRTTGLASAASNQTVMVWCNVSGTSGTYGVPFYIGDDPQGPYADYVVVYYANAGGGTLSTFEVGIGGVPTSQTFTNPALETWVHYAYTRTGTTHRLYINGVLAATIAGVNWAAASYTHNLCGSDSYPTNSATVGYYREWQSALSAAEILAEMVSAVAVKASCFTDTPLTDSLLDISGHGHDWTAIGTLTLAPALSFPLYLDITTPYSYVVPWENFNAGTYGGVVRQTWLRYVADATQVFGIGTTDPYSATWHAQITIFASDGTTALQGDGPVAVNMDWGVSSGSTYYIRIRGDAGAIPADQDFTVTAEVTPYITSVDENAIIINDDTSPYPGVAVALDGTILGYVVTVPASEIGDSMSTGIALWQNIGGGATPLRLLARDQSIIADFDLPTPLGSARPRVSHSDTDFYVANGLANSKIYKVTTAGVATLVSTLTGGETAEVIAVNGAGTILYYLPSLTGRVIKAWDLTNDLSLGTFHTIAALAGVPSYRVARTQNTKPGDMLRQSDGSLVTWYRNLTTPQDTIIQINSSGTLTHSWNLATTTAQTDHLAYSPDNPTAVYIWTQVSPFAEGTFGNFDLTTGTFIEFFNTNLFREFINLKADSSQLFGPSQSCTMVSMLSEAPPPVTTGSIIVNKVTVPAGSAQVFAFTTGGLTPSGFTLIDGGTESFTDLVPGSGFSVAETALVGWTTTYDVSNDSPIDNLSVGEGETVVVTVTNTLSGTATLAGLNIEELRVHWLRRSPHLCEELTRMFHQLFQLDMNVGNGLTHGQGIDPQVMLRWSDDGGHTWSNEHWVSSGPKGQYKRRVIWRRLGSARDRVYEVSGSDPVAVALVEAYLQVEQGLS